MEDEMYCVGSANSMRHFLTSELFRVRAGRSLATSIRAIRAALREFVDAAGPGARNFRHHGGAMTDEILPPPLDDDPSIVPGFEDAPYMGTERSGRLARQAGD
jgi:hypothetical protein